MELDEPFDFPDRPQAYAAVEIFHPGTGTVTSIEGESGVQAHPATREFRLKVKPGDRITRRESVGQDIGYLLHTHDSPAGRLARHDAFRRQFAINID
jgi:hypothetical protein